jgi:probable FeS assembly SUF system protein SufT
MERVQITREVAAVAIPAGHDVTLEEGMEAYVMQALGGSFTLRVPIYGLVRIAGRDADAIGKQPEDAGQVASEGASLEEQVWSVLRTCYDPEIPVNIVDLGLVYSMEMTPGADGAQVDVKMTLTAQGCGMGGAIASDARNKLLALPGVRDANVDIVWDPPWNPQMISAEGRERLGMA